MKTDNHLYGKAKTEFLSEYELECFKVARKAMVNRLLAHHVELQAKRPLDIKQQCEDVEEAIRFWESV